MKEFKCFECGKYLGKMEKGEIHKRAKLICESCMQSYKTYKDLADYKKSSGQNDLDFEKIFKTMINKPPTA